MYFTELIHSFEDCTTQSHVYNNANLSSYRFLTDEIDSYDFAYLYVGTASSLLNRPSQPTNASLLIVCDEAVDAAALALNQNSFVLIDEKTELLELFQRVRKFFGSEKFLFQSNKVLLKASQQGLSIQELIDLACGILGNPIMFVDIALCLVSYSNGPVIPDEPFWNETIETGHMPKYYIDAIEGNLADSSRTIVLEWTPECAKNRLAFGKVFVCKTPVGYIKLLEYNRRLTSADLELLELLCRVVAIEVRSNTQTSEQQQFSKMDTFLLLLLDHKLRDEATIRERMRLLSISLKENRFVLCMESAVETMFAEKNFYVKQVFQGVLGTHLCAVYNQQVVFLLDTQKQPETFIAELEKQLVPYLKEHNLNAGLSNIFHTLKDFPERHMEASTSLKIMQKLNADKRFCSYNSVVVYHIIETSINKYGINHFRNATLEKLLEDGGKKSNDLVNTLDVYLCNNLELSPSSKELFIHYNTMKYRVNRIAELASFDFSDKDAVMHLQLCLMAYRLLAPASILPSGRFDEDKLRELIKNNEIEHLEPEQDE